MKAQASQAPEPIKDLGRLKRFNFNIEEKSMEDDTIFKFEYVTSSNNRNALITALIRRKYTSDDEIALINNYQDGEASHVEEYEEYQAYRNECKTIANQFFPV
ncbi:MAG: hypothetical protein ACOC2F_03195 [Bacteroidota bacterium]